jgi:carbamoyl-phosphate synthase large subunit
MKAVATDCGHPNVVRTPTFYADLGFTLYATSGTGSVISEADIPVNILPKLARGQRLAKTK